MLFGITTEWCSASQRNRVHLRPDFPRDLVKWGTLAHQFGSNAIRVGHLTDEDYKRDYSPDPQDTWVKANSAEFLGMLKTALAESGGLSQN